MSPFLGGKNFTVFLFSEVLDIAPFDLFLQVSDSLKFGAIRKQKRDSAAAESSEPGGGGGAN